MPSASVSVVVATATVTETGRSPRSSALSVPTPIALLFTP